MKKQLSFGRWLRVFPAAVMIMASQGADPARAEELRKIDMAIPSTTIPTIPPMLADKLGLFEKHGLKPNFIIMETGSAATTALLSGSISIIVGGPGEHVAAAARGQEIVALVNLYKGLGGTVVLSKAAAERAGVKSDATAAEKWKALDNMVIASSSATSSYTVAVRSAGSAQAANIRFAYMPQTNMAAATETGAVDGFMASAPVWTIPVVNGKGVFWVSGPTGDFPPQYAPAASTSIQMMRAAAKADPKLVSQLRAIMDGFEQILRDDPERVRQVMIEFYPQLSRESVDLMFKNESPPMLTDPLTVEDMAHEIAFVKSAGANIPNIDKIDPSIMILK
jgi:ABC-type nitrate/sulfonate/bicarbonate transport system substrate-binding protein